MRRGEACHDRRIESWRPRAADSPPQTRRPCAAKPINVTVSHRRPIPLTLAGVLLVATLWLIAALIVGAAPGAAASPSVDVGATQLLDQQLSAYATTAGPFSSGVWNSPNQVCWACNEGGPATAAATSWLVGGSGDAADLGWAEATVDHVIATEQLANGSYQADAGSSPDITTMFWGVEMGTTYLELEPTLSASERSRWQQSLSAAAGYLIAHGDPTWYTNGNVDLGEAEFFYLTYRATGDPAFLSAYNTTWNTALRPDQRRWPGAGLVVTRTPTASDDSDGAGYLAEIGPGGTGLDPEYAELQLDEASRLYLLSGDRRALQLANLLVNQLLPRVTSQWQLDTSGGTRHTQPDRYVYFLTSAFAVLSQHGGRADLAGDVAPLLATTTSRYNETDNLYSQVFRRALGDDIATIALSSLPGTPLAANGYAPPSLGGTSLGVPAS